MSKNAFGWSVLDWIKTVFRSVVDLYSRGLAGLFGDRTTPTRAMWTRSWPWALLTAILLVLAFVPAQWLHGMNHRWALGADPVIVWALMIFDSLLVGLLAGLTGTALYLGYAAFRDQAAPPPTV